jgi:hypothetical protein
MKKFSFGCLIILIYSFQLLQAQTYVKLFSDYLPDKYLKDEEKLEQMEYNLNLFAQTNPDLIYFYLNYLNSISEKKIFNRDSNYYNILQYEISINNSYNNKWVEEEITEAKKLKEPELIIQKLESLLDEFRAPESNEPKYTVELKIDRNLQKFFTYKCLTQDIYIIYDEKSDYNRIVDATIENLISKIKLEYKNIQSDVDYIPEIKFKNLLQYHIFSNGFSDGFDRKIEFNFAKYLLSFIDYSEFKEYSGIIIGVNAEIVQYEFSNEKIKEPYLPFHEFTLDNTTNKMIYYNLSASYRIKLKEYKAAFSHVDISFGWSFTSSKIQSDSKRMAIDKYIFVFAGKPSDFLWVFNGTINSVSWEINKFSSLTSNINLPILYLDNKLYFELGLQYKYFLSEYSVTVDREIIEQMAVDPNILAPEIETFNHKSKRHLFGGSIVVNFSIINSLNLKGILSTLPSVQIGIEYLIAL